MTTGTRDSIALYLIATLAVLVTIFAGSDPAQLFNALLAGW